MPIFAKRRAACLAAFAPVLVLAGCVSLGEDPPESLLSLTPTRTAAAGEDTYGSVAQAIAVFEPDAPRKLDVVRVPVQVNDSTVAYLQDAVWVEKPARLFAALVSETIRASGSRLVIEGADIRHSAATRLTGQLLEMGYDASSGSVVVRFDAILQLPDGQVRTRRFEAEVNGVLPEAMDVGPALNRAANQVAGEVADWVG